MKEPLIHLVGIRCKPEAEEKFNRWYNEVHVPMLMKFKGLKEVTRYRIASESPEYPNYLAVYKFDNYDVYQAYDSSPERAAVSEEMKQTWKGDEFKVVWRVQYQPLKTFKR